MTTPSPGELETAFARAHQLQAEVARRERAVGRRIAVLAKGLAALMQPGEHLHRQGVGIHAFEVNGAVCLAAAYLEEKEDAYRYRYAILCGGEAARQTLRTAPLDPGDSDQSGAERRIALASYSEFQDFLGRLPTFVNDVNQRFERRLAGAAGAEDDVRAGQRLIRGRQVEKAPSGLRLEIRSRIAPLD